MRFPRSSTAGNAGSPTKKRCVRNPSAARVSERSRTRTARPPARAYSSGPSNETMANSAFPGVRRAMSYTTAIESRPYVLPNVGTAASCQIAANALHSTSELVSVSVHAERPLTGRLETLSEISRPVSSTLDLRHLYDVIYQQVG